MCSRDRGDYNPETDNNCTWKWFGCTANRRKLFHWTFWPSLVVTIIIVAVLLGTSIRKVEQNTLAIPYCTISRSVGDVLDDGLYNFCPDVELFTYDRKFIDNDLRLNCLTMDGLVMTLDVTVQYQLLKDELIDVFYEFGRQESLDTYIDTIAKSTIRDVCALYNGNDFYNKRGIIEQNIISNVTLSVDRANAHVITGFIQLKNIALPTQLQEAINGKQLALEDVDVAKNERQQALIDLETQKLQAIENLKIKELQARAAGDAVIINAREKAEARMTTWKERTAAIITNKNALGITPEKYADEYLFPRLNADTLDRDTQICLRNSNSADSWWCWVHPGAITVNP